MVLNVTGSVIRRVQKSSAHQLSGVISDSALERPCTKRTLLMGEKAFCSLSTPDSSDEEFENEHFMRFTRAEINEILNAVNVG